MHLSGRCYSGAQGHTPGGKLRSKPNHGVCPPPQPPRDNPPSPPPPASLRRTGCFPSPLNPSPARGHRSHADAARPRKDDEAAPTDAVGGDLRRWSNKIPKAFHAPARAALPRPGCLKRAKALYTARAFPAAPAPQPPPVPPGTRAMIENGVK